MISSSSATLFNYSGYKKEKGDLGRLTPRDIELGVMGGAISLSMGYFVLKGSEFFMEMLGLKSAHAQSYFFIYESLGKISHALLRGVLRVFAVVYVTLLVPIVEEWFFRDLIYKMQESEKPAEEPIGARIYRVISSGIIFGAFHFSLLQGWANIAIVAVSTVAGVVFAVLRELTGDRWSSTVAHSLNNSLVLFVNVLKI